MTAINVLVDRWLGDYEGGEDSDEPYRYRGRRPGNVNVTGIEVANSAGYKDLDVDFSIEDGKTYYVLWGEYSTGDSFGTEDGNYEIIDVYSDKDLAIKNCRLVEEASRKDATYDSNRPICTLKRQGGAELKFSYFPWQGYFERLNKLEVTPVRSDKSKFTIRF